jgi:aminoglycoside phosphotransferase (APT) family kinase protein
MTTVETPTELDARVRAAIAAAEPGVETAPLETLPGGHSGLTYRTAAGDRALVIKAVPPGQRSIGRHDMLRQARIMAALQGSGVPVPTIRAVDDVEPAWFAMDLVEGESLEPVLDDPAVAPTLAAARMRRAADLMPRLHAVDLATLPIDAPALTPADELSRWVRTMGAVPPELVPAAEEVRSLLEAHVPAPLAPVLVHGDYRLGNIIARGTEPVALIDWEIWAAGDPRVELGWFAVFADGDNFPGVGRYLEGLPDLAEILDRYADGGPALPDFTWFDALGRFKMAAIMGHNLRRHREGRHHDPAQEQLPATIERLLSTARERLR